MNSRDLKFDGLKAFLIFLVVLGHLNFNDFGLGVKRIIYSFHMPVFIFLSGYFTSLKNNKDYNIQWLKKTFYLYILVQISHYILRILIGFIASNLNGTGFDLLFIFDWDILISPSFALWYLICLIYWRLIIWNVHCNDYILLAISITTSILAGFIPIDYAFSFQRAFAFAPYFILGVFYKKHNLISQLESLPLYLAIIGLLLVFYVVRQMPPYLPTTHFESGQDIVRRIVQTSLGLLLCPLIIRLSRSHFVEFFAKYGEKTLWIYIGHTFFIILGESVFNYMDISLNLFTAILLSLIYCIFFYVVANLYDTFKKSVRKQQLSSNP